MVNLNLYAWVVRGKHRIALLKVMDRPLTPSQTYKKIKVFNEKMSFNNTSDVLRKCVRQGVAVCINEEARKGRIYQLTDAGEEIRAEMMKG